MIDIITEKETEIAKILPSDCPVRKQDIFLIHDGCVRVYPTVGRAALGQEVLGCNRK